MIEKAEPSRANARRLSEDPSPRLTGEKGKSVPEVERADDEDDDVDDETEEHAGRPPFLVWSCARTAVDPFEAVMASIVVLIASRIYQTYLCPSPRVRVSTGSADARPGPFTLDCPSCPKCGRPMVLRHPKGATTAFWGCSQHRAVGGACNATRDAALLFNAHIV